MNWLQAIWQTFRTSDLTRGERDVLLTLATYRHRSGVAWPAHATLAERARCSVKTVQRALARARQLGLLRWSHRTVRAAWRTLRTSNAYIFLGWPTNGHFVAGGESKKETRGDEADRDALAEVRRGMEARLAARRGRGGG